MMDQKKRYSRRSTRKQTGDQLEIKQEIGSNTVKTDIKETSFNE